MSGTARLGPELMHLAVSLFLSLTSVLSLRLSTLIYSSLTEIDHACRTDNTVYIWHDAEYIDTSRLFAKPDYHASMYLTKCIMRK